MPRGQLQPSQPNNVPTTPFAHPALRRETGGFNYGAYVPRPNGGVPQNQFPQDARPFGPGPFRRPG